MAGGFLTLSVATFVVVGLLAGTLSARWPQHRAGLVLAMIALMACTWTVLLALPSPAPHWLLALLVVVISAGQPVSILAFDFARTYNPPAALGTAQGMVNTGGFIATLVIMQVMGSSSRWPAAIRSRPSGWPGPCSTSSGRWPRWAWWSMPAKPATPGPSVRRRRGLLPASREAHAVLVYGSGDCGQ